MDVTIRPDGVAWRRALGAARTLSGEQREFRGELGLPSSGPLVMGGHQAQVWHPGILAKLLAMRAAAARSGASVAWVVVDQDEADPWVVRYPVRRADGTLEARTWRMDGSAKGTEAHVPGVSLAPVREVRSARLASGERYGAPGVEAGLARIAAAVNGESGAASAAMQVGRATIALAGAEDVHVFGATSIGRTSLFARLVERMRAEPERMAGAYNAAVRRHAGARVAELAPGELPVWHIAPKRGAARRRVTVETIGGVKLEELSPRALLMTGLLRWAGCDLFVHGTGGAGGVEGAGAGGYDAIMTEWFREWLGVEVAPAALATATVRLDFSGDGAVVTPQEIARVRWMAHAARHRPALLEDLEGAALSGSAVATLTRLKHRRDPESRRVKREAFRALHTVLNEVRGRHEGTLRELDAAASRAAARREEAEIVADRTWAFPLYEAGQVEELRRGVEGELMGR